MTTETVCEKTKMKRDIEIALLFLALVVFMLFVSRENAREVINLIIR